MKEAILFGATWCPACQQAKKYLTSKGHSFQYVDIDTTEGRKQFDETIIGGRSIPVFVVKSADSMQTALGFVPSKFEEMLR